jgi:hypothetical protein
MSFNIKTQLTKSLWFAEFEISWNFGLFLKEVKHWKKNNKVLQFHHLYLNMCKIKVLFLYVVVFSFLLSNSILNNETQLNNDTHCQGS